MFDMLPISTMPVGAEDGASELGCMPAPHAMHINASGVCVPTSSSKVLHASRTCSVSDDHKYVVDEDTWNAPTEVPCVPTEAWVAPTDKAPLLVSMTEVATTTQRHRFQLYTSEWDKLSRGTQNWAPDKDAVNLRIATVFSSRGGSVPSLIELGRTAMKALEDAQKMMEEDQSGWLPYQVEAGKRRLAMLMEEESADDAHERLLAYLDDTEGIDAAVLRRAFLTHVETMVGGVEPLPSGDAYPWVRRT